MVIKKYLFFPNIINSFAKALDYMLLWKHPLLVSTIFLRYRQGFKIFFRIFNSKVLTYAWNFTFREPLGVNLSLRWHSSQNKSHAVVKIGCATLVSKRVTLISHFRNPLTDKIETLILFPNPAVTKSLLSVKSCDDIGKRKHLDIHDIIISWI